MREIEVKTTADPRELNYFAIIDKVGLSQRQEDLASFWKSRIENDNREVALNCFY